MNRIPRRFAVFGFASTHDALDAEALLAELGVESVPIPAPASLGALCGIALRIEPEDESRARKYLERAGVVIKSQGEVEDV